MICVLLIYQRWAATYLVVSNSFSYLADDGVDHAACGLPLTNVGCVRRAVRSDADVGGAQLSGGLHGTGISVDGPPPRSTHREPPQHRECAQQPSSHSRHSSALLVGLSVAAFVADRQTAALFTLATTPDTAPLLQAMEPEPTGIDEDGW